MSEARFESLISNDETYRVHWRSIPEPIPLNEPFALEVAIFSRDNSDQDPLIVDLSVDGRMPEHRHGMNVIPPVMRRDDGWYEISNLLVHMPGYWQIHIDVTRGGVTERAQADVDLE